MFLTEVGIRELGEEKNMLFILRQKGIKVAARKLGIFLVTTIAILILANLEIIEEIQGSIEIMHVSIKEALIILTIIGVLSTLYAFCMLLRAFTGTYQTNIKKYLKKNTNILMEQIETDFLRAELIDKHIWVGQRWTIYLDGPATKIIDNKSIIWVYYRERTEVINGVTATYRNLILNDRDKEVTMIDISSQKAGSQILANYRKSQKHIVLGYSNEIQKVYINNFNEFLKYSNTNNHREIVGTIEYKAHKI